MEQSPWEANSFTASQDISHILWNQKLPCHIDKRPQNVKSEEIVNIS